VSVKLPWWAKIGAKIVLSRLPFGYQIWQKIGLFRHGKMDQSTYLVDIFNRHVTRVNLANDLKGKTLLELGPGDSVGTALVAASHGAKSILLDAGEFAVGDVEVYKKLSKELVTYGLNPPDLSNASSLSDVLGLCDAQYLTDGLNSFKDIESGSVDLIFSQAVLEHVRKDEFLGTMRECLRVLSERGVASHRVDLKDHLEGGLNNLRFSEKLWESDFFVDSGFYTNRIQFSEMLGLFKKSGFEVDVLGSERWEKLPINRKSLDSKFSDLSDKELMVKGFDVILKAGASSAIC